MQKKDDKKKIEISIVTPEQKVYEGLADYISLPAKSGSIGILPGHIPIISQLKIGILKIVNEGEAIYIGVCRGHFEYFGAVARVLTEKAIITTLEESQLAIEELKKKHDITQEITEETRKIIQAIAELKRLKR